MPTVEENMAQVPFLRNSVEFPDLNSNLTSSLPTIIVSPPSEESPPSTALTTRKSNELSRQAVAPLTTFEKFPKLPPEIRLLIWDLSAAARIVSFTPGGGKAPGAMHANRESYSLLRPQYRLCIKIFRLKIFEDTPDFGFFINFDRDIVHMNPLSYYFYKQRPGETHEIDPLVLRFPNGGESFERAIIEHPLELRMVKNIAFDLESKYPISRVGDMWGNIVDEPTTRLAYWCPALENLYVIQSDDIGTDVEQLEATTSGTRKHIYRMNVLATAFDEVFYSARIGEHYKWWDHKLNLKFLQRKESGMSEADKLRKRLRMVREA